ncbi:MAG: polysaccharide deacetylase family protein, partial [Candidatus Hydrogenedentes bacterium]|nr:polysaccharide deacetylase family protein [Candidatus Hydrogenedentota bacterium]
NLTDAAPVLAQYGIPAVVFVVTGRMGGMLDHDLDPATSTLLTWDQARELQAMGVEIGGHTKTHRRLSQLSIPEQETEIVECARQLRWELGAELPLFAYPFGSAFDYDKSSKELAKRAGFSCAYSNRYGGIRSGDDPWELRRIWIDASDSMESFKSKVDGTLDMLAVFESRAGLYARKLLNRFTRG